ncbi:hypothetical protein LTR62_003000 [Meristemomyces frigidus]|uniref:FAD-binding domain-containing protein n=1 Tax=Meristemomyces frigidus TaxID=1508187 RepID=A0AAN7TX97_9PEZI|nr:hypothetical protein LTR62_003000 [Meristemomyces frigidus]
MATATNEKPFSVAIVGAGIGGLSLAIGLLKQKVPCTIYEGAARFDIIGAGIGMGPNALRAIELMDPKFARLYDEIKVGNTSADRVHEQFEILGAEEGFGITDAWQGGRVSHPDFTRSSAHRHDLLRVMRSLIPEGTVQFNRRVAKLSNGPGSKASIEFESGDIVEADIVIGCDGIKGLSRSAVLAGRWPEEVLPKYNHSYVYRGIASMEDAKKRIGSYAEDARWWMSPRKGWTMYPISKGREVNIVAFMYDEDEWKGPPAATEVPREEMLAEFKEFDHRLQGMLDFVKPVKWPLYHHPDTPSYYNSRLCLLGDSAHASSPSQAAGAGQGLEDALLLSRLLGLVKAPQELDAAIQAYDAIRRPRAQGVVRQSRDVGRAYYLIDPEFGTDLQRITDEANQRLPQIWWHDLDADCGRAGEMFRALSQTALDSSAGSPRKVERTTKHSQGQQIRALLA